MTFRDQMVSYHVRAARKSDVSALARLLNVIVAAGGTTAIEETLTDDRFDDWFISGPRVLFCNVAEHSMSGKLLGFQSVCRDPDLPAGWGDIATFASTDHKVPGVGTRMFASSLANAKERELIALNATIRADNSQGLAYYMKMGFVTYRTLEAVPLRNGTPVDRILKRYGIA